MHRVLGIDADIAFVDMVEQDVGQQLALERVAQSEC